MNKIVAQVMDLVEENTMLKIENAELKKQTSSTVVDPQLALLPYATDRIVEDIGLYFPSFTKKVDDHEEIVDLETWLSEVENMLSENNYHYSIAQLQKYCLTNGIKLETLMEFLNGALVRWYASKTKEWLEKENAKNGTESN